MQQPGWYYAQGDPAGSQRYWDGELWIGEPQFVPAPPAPGPQGGVYHQYPESSQATTALVMSILSFVICGLLAPVGWVMGSKEVAAIDAGRRDPNNRGTAQAAKIIGMIMTILIILGIVFVIFVLGFTAYGEGPVR